MKLKNCTLAEIKAVYMKKIEAQETNDYNALAQLKLDYPELFNAEFLLDILRNEFERIQSGTYDNVKFKSYLTVLH